LKEAIELQYHSEHNKVFYSNTIGMTPLTDESEYILIMVWSKLIQRLDSVMLMISLVSPSNASKFITHIFLPLERIVQELIGYS
jgi:hypothetical protein